VGVRHPVEPSRIWTAIADPGAGLSVSTSGNYAQPIKVGGRTYYHILDPRSGRPVSIHTLSVSVAFPETGKSWLADVLSTAGAALGPEKALPLVRGLSSWRRKAASASPRHWGGTTLRFQ
jgi:thiamine biosynthesis lipoprotein